MKIKTKLILLLFLLIITLNMFLYSFDKLVTPIILSVADGEMRAKALEIINNCIIEQYSNDFKYDDVIKVEKDDLGNIVMLKADTLILNKIAVNVSMQAQSKLKALGNLGIKIPIGYIFRNNFLSFIGPSIPIKMYPIGHIETKYESEFQSAGINQTRHKIYVRVKTQVRVIIPMKSNVLEVNNEIPICETIIVGKIPNTTISLDLQKSGFTIPNQ